MRGRGLLFIPLSIGGSAATAGAALWGTAGHWLVAVGVWYAIWAWSLRRPMRRSAVVALALGLRIVWIPVPLVLSDDAYRYVWDGLVVLEGGNPYVQPPNKNLLLQDKHPWLFERLNSPAYHSVYPTLSQAAFLPVAALYRAGGGGERGWRWAQAGVKGVFGGAELLVLGLLARRVSRRRLAMFGLCPLVVVDGFGQPHTESLALLLLVAAVLTPRTRPTAQIALTGLAGWVKLWPFALLSVPSAPLAHRGTGVDARLRGAGALALLAVLALPLATPGALEGLRTSLNLYVRLFEFNAGPYYAFKAIGQWVTGDDVSKTLGPALRTVFVIGATGMLVMSVRRRWGLAVSSAAIGALFLVTATTVHPWYLVPLLGLLAVSGSRSSGASAGDAMPSWLLSPLAWHALGAGSLATYAVYPGASVGWIVAAGWGAWVILLFKPSVRRMLRWPLEQVMRLRAEQKLACLSPALPPDLTGLRVLDLGCGEGFVGYALDRRGAAVTLADVSPQARGALPFVAVADGGPLPFADAAFDAVVLVFVLHHARDPEALLREACRVGRRVIVLESVFETSGEERVLRHLDILFNRLRGGWMRSQEEYLAFRTAEAWRSVLETTSRAPVQLRRLGSIPHRQALLWT